jgi:septum formation protein
MATEAPPVLILASASPRRRALLRQLGVPHRAHPADIDEQRLAGEAVADCVSRLARAKAEHVWNHEGRAVALPVLAADTAVVIDDRLLGKPANRADALRMLALLSGRSHRVLTAVALLDVGGLRMRLSDSTVRFRALAAEECARYWDTREPRDKAGGYAIQGFGAAFVSGLEGSYSGVMGLPLFEVAELLHSAGLPVWQECAA